ncbi:acyltransferase [Mycetocola sp. 2940]|uniref:acyltransferase n=1 Tax=Mycetocola sp. 2940 TaxID=3156452 RepID=UPI003395A4A4
MFINYGCFFDLAAPTVIGARASLGFEVMLLTSTHKMGPPSKRAGDSDAKSITIGEGAWIGARATIMPGVNVGSGCVIAAGSVVVSDCEPDSLYAGIPAVLKRRLEDPSDPSAQHDEVLYAD